MKKVFFVGLIIILMSCARESVTPESSGIELQVNLSLGSVSTRAADESIIGGDGKGYVLPFTEVKTLKVELYKSLHENPIFTHTASSEEITKIKNTPTGQLAKLSIAKIPVATQYIKVIINQFTASNPDINHLQVTNRDDSPAPTMTRKDIPYEGTSTSIVIVPEESTTEATKVRATVEVTPVLTRFEIAPGEITITNPTTAGYVFDWVDGTEGRAKVTKFTEAEIIAGEASARENFKKKYGTEASTSAVYSYCVKQIHSSFPTDLDINSIPTDCYVNYFKQNFNSTALVKNGNDGVSDWNMAVGFAQYIKGGKHSNMYDTRTTDKTQVNAFHLFPQSTAANEPTLQQVKDEMPHIILGFYYTDTRNIQTGTRATGRPARWLTIRSFRNKSSNEIIHAFEPGYCYSLALDDVILTPWSLGLKVRITDGNKTAESDPIIKDFDQTSHVPEPEGLDLTIGLKVSKWRNNDLEVEL